MDIIILKQAKRELSDAPPDVIQDVFALFDNLAAGKKLSMPVSRPLPSVAKGLHELRISGNRGEYRVFYVICVANAIYIIHATVKKKNALDIKTVQILKARIRGLGL